MRNLPARRRLAAAFLQLAIAFSLGAAGVETFVGTVEVLTSDDFAGGRSERIPTLLTDDGRQLVLRLGSESAEPETGARVAVRGQRVGEDLWVEDLQILREAPAAPEISGNTTVIAILIKFLDTASEPFTQAQVETKVFGEDGTSEYYAETSYGTHTLSGLVTPWLTATINTPTTCDYGSVAAQAMDRAQAAGYNPNAYQKRVYIFPHIPCGWAGLGGGSQAWINQSLSVLVIGHELGHCFGLGHASSLDCGTLPIGGTCTRSEYGDRFSIMGNSNARHVNAYHKNQLGYLPAGTVATQTSGSAVHTLDPIASPGGTLYAVKLPFPAMQRTYWLEFRQPTGFDAGNGGNLANGALVHVAPDSGYGCSSCLLDMTESSGFGDAAIEVGQSFTDPIAGLRITPLLVDGNGLAVQVELGPPPALGVDRSAAGGGSNLNGILEPGETASVEPSFENGTPAPLAVAGSATAFSGPAGAVYAITDGTADYGSVAEAATARCIDATGDCHAVSVSQPALRPSAHWDTSFEETLSTAAVRSWTLHVGGSFADTPLTRSDYAAVETVFHFGITSGCGGSSYCPDGSVTRAQMAIFLLRAKYGSDHVPPPATGQVFADVPAGAFAAAWIEQLAAEGVTAGCGSGVNYCPGSAVTRAQMAVFLLKTKHGSAFAPPTPVGIFADVPVGNAFARWVEALYAEGVTAGCGGGLYCPSSATRRGQMAVFLTKAFDLALYGP